MNSIPEFTEVEPIDVEPVEASIIPAPELYVEFIPASITDNIAALDAYIESEVAIYRDWKIDPNDTEMLKAGRNAAAALNKLKEPIETERKRIKAEYEKPLKAFESQVKIITKKIDDARASIKQQLDTADQLFKDARHSMLKEEYEGAVGIMADVIGFDAVLDPKWLNRSTPETKALNEMVEKALKAKEGYDTLMAKELNHKDEVVHKYATTLDVIAALKVEDELNEHDRQMAEFKARQEAMARAKTPEPPAPEPKPEQPAEPEKEYVWELNLTFTGPKILAVEVAQALKNLGISGGKIHPLREA